MILNLSKKSLVLLMLLMLMIPMGGYGQDRGDNHPTFSQAELDQLLASIALYPDSLLVQVLMAATYPLEVVSAARWVQENPDLKGDDLAMALEKMDWDPSVKSLVNVPSVLAMMNEKIAWTEKVGDAFLAQEGQVMDTIQQLREKAYTQGNLRTTPEQNVMVQDREIVIESAAPDIIYVPCYNPFVVYGPWWYPSYPPYYYYPPGYSDCNNVFFSFGLYDAWGYAWGIFDWPHRHCFINVNRHSHRNHYINRQGFIDRYKLRPDGYGEWRHDPHHRHGVIYRDRDTSEKFGQGPRAGTTERQLFRGRFPDTKTWEPGITEHPSISQPRSSERGESRFPEKERDTTGGSSAGHGGSVFEQRDRPSTASPGERTRSDGIILPPERPRNAFDSIERSGRNADLNSDRGRESRQRTFSSPPGGPADGSWDSPHEGGSQGGRIMQRGGGGRGNEKH
jgi:hypothetical protein